MTGELPDFRRRASGKLLLTGEYFVLDGALALAAPTRLGQELRVWQYGAAPGTLEWTSYTPERTPWFRARWQVDTTLSLLDTDDTATAARLTQLLEVALSLRPAIIDRLAGAKVETHLEFPRAWGMGTSSTLVHLLGEWLAIDAWTLLQKTFGGSGYDLACAGAHGPLLYRLQAGQPHWLHINWYPAYAEKCYFVYLGQKQNSREGIRHYRERAPFPTEVVDTIEALTLEVAYQDSAQAVQTALQQHETLVAAHLNMKKVQDKYFADFAGTVKSLGAWGGDFVWVVSNTPDDSTRRYFNEKGYETVFTFAELFGPPPDASPELGPNAPRMRLM